MLISEQLAEFDTLSSSEKSVAHKVLESGPKIETMTIRDLAEAAYTATSAVTRMAKKLGFNGYQEFKDAYLDELHYLNTHFTSIDANEPFTKDDNLSRVCNSLGFLYEETSKDTLSLVDYSQLIRAIDQIEKARNIYVLCYGVGLELAKVYCDRMMRLGKRVVVTDNINQQFYQTYHCGEDDCFIVISYTGTTRKIQTYLKNIIANQAHSILITSIGEKDLSTKAEVVLRMSTRERLYSNIANFTSVVSTMLILDMLYSGYFHRNYEENFALKKKLAREYEDCRTSISILMEED